MWERHGLIFRWRGPFREPDDDELAEYTDPDRTHGTWAGYMQHVYRRERACTACRQAAREKGRERRRREQERQQEGAA